MLDIIIIIIIIIIKTLSDFIHLVKVIPVQDWIGP